MIITHILIRKTMASLHYLANKDLGVSGAMVRQSGLNQALRKSDRKTKLMSLNNFQYMTKSHLNVKNSFIHHLVEKPQISYRNSMARVNNCQLRKALNPNSISPIQRPNHIGNTILRPKN